MKKNVNKKASAILIAILMIGFLLVLVAGVFNLMLKDMKDNRGAGNYLKSYAGAEGAMELGLLKIKEKGYGVDEDLSETNSGILSFHSGKNNEPKISYKMNILTDDYSGKIGTGKTLIIPLFSNNNYVKEPDFSVNTSGLEGDIIWNIVGKGEGMSGTGNFDSSDNIYYKKNDGSYETKDIKTFLGTNTGSYLMLFNKSTSDEIEYELKAESNFSKPVGTIISSVTVGKFRQNITTDIDNTEFLNMLKYSLFSK